MESHGFKHILTESTKVEILRYPCDEPYYTYVTLFRLLIDCVTIVRVLWITAANQIILIILLDTRD